MNLNQNGTAQVLPPELEDDTTTESGSTVARLPLSAVSPSAALAQLLARQWELPFYADDEISTEEAASTLISPEEARTLQACPTSLSEDGSVQVAVAEPTEKRFDAAVEAVQHDCSFAVVTKQTLERLIAELSDPPETIRSPNMNMESMMNSLAEAAEPTSDEARLLLADLDDTTSQLSAFRERLEQVVERQLETDRELAESREQLVAATGECERMRSECEHERATVARLEEELARHQELLSVVKGKLSDVSGALGMELSDPDSGLQTRNSAGEDRGEDRQSYDSQA